MNDGGYGRVWDVIRGLSDSVVRALDHDHDGRPDEGGAHDGQPARIWPSLL